MAPCWAKALHGSPFSHLLRQTSRTGQSQAGRAPTPIQILRCLSAARGSRGVLFPASGFRVIATWRMAGRSRSCAPMKSRTGALAGARIRAGSMVLRRQEATQTGAHSIRAAFTTLPIPELITATSPANWSPTERVISRWAEARSCRVRRLMCSMLPVADGRLILIRRIHTLILTRCSQFSRRSPIHRAALAIQR